jgi:alcohol dehydrogenase YqhD (iron-dependent ADH family)
MDAAKVIAAAVLYAGDSWDMIFHSQEHLHIPTQALPVVTVPTLAATGSEMNCGAVITNEETSEKSFVQTGCLYPYAAVVDPELTLTVPKDQTAYGVGHNVTMEY